MMGSVPPIPVYSAARHLRLSTTHLAVLFGEQRLQRLLTLSWGAVASDGLVGVAGPDGEILNVRVLLPTVARTEVHLSGADAVSIGLPIPAVVLDNASGCTLHGPAGVVVLANGVVNAERLVLPGPLVAERVDLNAEFDRPRLYRRIGVVVGDRAAAFLLDDTGELRAGSMATIG